MKTLFLISILAATLSGCAFSKAVVGDIQNHCKPSIVAGSGPNGFSVCLTCDSLANSLKQTVTTTAP